MELTVLRYFVTVARKLHFRKAAAELNMTQAPLSAAVRKLEDELGTELFKRTSRSVELTPAGRFFLTEAEAVLNRADQAQRRMQEYLNRQTECLSIGYNEPAIHSFLPGLLASMHEKQPDLHLNLRELETLEQWELLKNGKLDIGFLRPINLDMSGLSAKLVMREKYVLAMKADHPLTKASRITGRDLADQQIILFARDVNPQAYDHLTAVLCAECRKPPRFRQDSRNKSSMLALVQAGFGIALLPESCCGETAGKIVIRKPDIPLPSVDIMAVWDPANVSSTLKAFLALL